MHGRAHNASRVGIASAKDNLSHEVLGSFIRRIAPARAGLAAENIAYGYESFEKTLGQWIDSSGHRRNLLASGKRTYWAMVIARLQGGTKRLAFFHSAKCR